MFAEHHCRLFGDSIWEPYHGAVLGTGLQTVKALQPIQHRGRHAMLCTTYINIERNGAAHHGMAHEAPTVIHAWLYVSS